MPRYIVTVTEVPTASDVIQKASETAPIPLSQEVFRQAVDSLDLPRVFAAVNFKKRERKPRVSRNPNLT